MREESKFGGRRREIDGRGDDGARAPLRPGRSEEEEKNDRWVPRLSG